MFRARLLLVKDLEGFEFQGVGQSELESHVQGRRLRILVVGDVFPWPARDGYRLRFASVIRALSELGDVDLFVGTQDEEIEIPSIALHRLEVVPAPGIPFSLLLFLRTCVSRLPSRMLWREWKGARSHLHRFVREPYDLVWYSHADSFVGMGNPSFGPAVVDLDNLEQNVLLQRFSSLASSIRGERMHHQLRLTKSHLVRRGLNRRDRFLWSRLQFKIARDVTTTVVCSEDDRRRLRGRRVAVVPNSYVDPGSPPEDIVAAPVLLMVGLFTYEPNLNLSLIHI